MATAKLFLDTRYSVNPSEDIATVKIAINHKGRSAAIPTEIRLSPRQWDKEHSKVIGHIQRKQLNRQLLTLLLSASNAMVDEIKSSGTTAMSASDLCRRVRRRMNGEVALPPPEPSSPDSVESYFMRYMKYKGCGPRTCELYAVTWRRIAKWLGRAAPSLKFEQINLQWIEEFDYFLKRTCRSANSRRIHHANLKAVINYAIDNDVIAKNPYRRYKIRTERTAKRNMSVESLRLFMTAPLEPWMEKYRDFFMLSFMFRGLNTVDLCRIGKPQEGRVDWVRTKTGQPLSLKIEPEMQSIIDKYAGKEQMVEFAEGRNYRRFNDRLTKSLHAIVKYINASQEPGKQIPDITMYWARHTWATIACKLDIAIDVIGTGLAHSEKSVTDIYIERDTEKIDIANRRVLDYVLYGTDYRNQSSGIR